MNHTGAIAAELRLNQRFRYFLTGRSVSLLGSSMTPVALAFAVLEQDGGARALGYVLAAQMVPMILLTVVGGGLADRIKRSTVLFWSNSISGLSQLGIASVLFSDLPIYLVVPLACVNGTAEAFTTPALRGAMADIVAVEQLTRANSLVNTVRNVAQIAGPSVAGLIVATTSGGVAIVIDGLAFLFAAWMMRLLRLPPPERKSGSTFLIDLKEGWRYFASSRWIWMVTVSFMLINFLQAGVWQILGPVIASGTIGPGGWGFVLSVKAVGLLLASLYLVRYARERKVSWALFGMSFAALPLVTLGLYANVPVLAVAAFVAGLVSAYFGIAWDTALQTRVPNEMISRVSSYDDLGAFVGIPAAQLTAVVLASQFGYSTVAVVGGVLFFLVALTPLVSRSFRSV